MPERPAWGVSMSLSAGRTLSHYRILRQVGAGGMGEVYEAEDLKLGRRVALKVLPEETARDPQRRERFEREARAVAALNHPNIVTLHSVEEADGLLFITLELLEGRTLRQMLPPGGLALGQLLEIALPLAEALAAAHQQGITHRDLKPENVLVTRDGKLKVLDFGLAKVEAAAFEASAGSVAPTRALTEEGRIVGTVAYMSPEQAEGMRVDARSDVFTLGIMLYELSTGERPFKGETTVSLLSSILKDHPRPLSEINTSLPRDLARIVDRCLMKDPARRFQSAMGLATELQTLKKDSDSGELPAVPSRSSEAAVRTAAAHPGGRRFRIILVSAGIVAVAAIAVATTWMARTRQGAPGAEADARRGGPPPAATSSDGRRKIVVLPFENLGTPDDAYFAAGMTEEISSRLAAVGGLGVISRTSSMQYAKTGKTTKQIGAELGVDYVLEGTVRWEHGRPGSSRVRVTPQLVRVSDETQLWGDRYDREMEDIFAVQSEIAEQVVGKLGLAMDGGAASGGGTTAPPTSNLDAYQAYLKGKADSDHLSIDVDIQKRGIEALETAVRLDPEFAQAWAQLSRAHTNMYHYRFDYSEDQLARSRECADRALALQPDLREGHLALGYYYYQGRHDYAQAAEEFRRVAGDRADDPDALEAMSYVLRRQGRWDEALAAMEKAYALNPRNVSLVSNLGGTYQALRRYPEALRFADLVITLTPGDPGALLSKGFTQFEADGNTRRARGTLARVSRKDFPQLPGVEALLEYFDRRYDKALALLSEFPDEVIDNQTLFQPKALVEGLTYLVMKDRARATARCESARKLLEREIAKNPRDARRRAAMSQALACLGRKEEAIREARLAADLSPVSADALEGPRYLENLAFVQVINGDFDAATDLLSRLLEMQGGTAPNIVRLDPIYAPLLEYPPFRKVMEKYP